MTDDIWRPGGSIDRDNEGGDEGLDNGDGWGTSNGNTTQEQDNPFGESAGDTGGKHHCFFCAP